MGLKKSSLSLTELLEENLVSEILDLYNLSKLLISFKKLKLFRATSNQVQMYFLLSKKLCQMSLIFSHYRINI